MTRGRLTALALTAALVTAACSSSPQAAAPGPEAAAPAPGSVVAAEALLANDGPNILVVTTDDMRWDELAYVPNVRKYVAARGLTFTNSFSPNPLCCPARASFLLGQYSHNHRVYSHEEPYGFGAFDDHLTLGTALNKAGYRTALVGKYLNGYGQQPSRVTGGPSVNYVPAGWTDWMVSVEKRWPVGSPFAGGTYNYRAFTQNVNGHTRLQPRALLLDRGRRAGAEPDREVRRRRAPVVHLGDAGRAALRGPGRAGRPGGLPDRDGLPRRSQTPARPAWVRGRFDAEITHAPGTRVKGSSERDVTDKPRFVRRLPEVTAVERAALLEVERQRAEALYVWDVQFGRIARTLKETGQYDNTVIVFTSDNGYFLGEHRQRLGKIKAHEPSLRVPLVVAGPGIPQGRRHAPVSTVDLTATIIDLASAAPLPAMDGASKVPVFAHDQPWNVPVVTEGLQNLPHKVGGFPHGLTEMGLRTGRYAFFRYSTGDGELYDLFRDPLELRSHYYDKAYADVRADLERLWRRYTKCSGDQCQRPLPAAYRVSDARLASRWPMTPLPGRATTGSRARRRSRDRRGACACDRGRARKSMSSSGAYGRPDGWSSRRPRFWTTRTSR